MPGKQEILIRIKFENNQDVNRSLVTFMYVMKKKHISFAEPLSDLHRTLGSRGTRFQKR